MSSLCASVAKSPSVTPVDWSGLRATALSLIVAAALPPVPVLFRRLVVARAATGAAVTAAVTLLQPVHDHTHLQLARNGHSLACLILHPLVPCLQPHNLLSQLRQLGLQTANYRRVSLVQPPLLDLCL